MLNIVNNRAARVVDQEDEEVADIDVNENTSPGHVQIDRNRVRFDVPSDENETNVTENVTETEERTITANLYMRFLRLKRQNVMVNGLLIIKAVKLTA